MKKNIFFFIGTTAELIKLAPVIKELGRRKADFKIISSSQNTLAFNEFEFLFGKQKKYYALKMKPFNLPHYYFRFLVWMVKATVNFSLYFKNLDGKNSLVIVHGDTVSSLIGALAAKFNGIKIAHIESGLRSFNFLEPFPEEICRYIVSRLADLHFCPNSWAINNLKHVGGKKINTYSNTLLETVLLTLKNTKYKRLKNLNKKYFVLVLHRQEHILFKKSLTKKFLNIFNEYTNNKLQCVLVLHKLTEKFLIRENLLESIKKNKNIILVPRLPYSDFLHLMNEAEFVATDGGSNQEECYYLGKPCLVLRNVTERIEGLGKNVILSHSNEKAIREFILNYKRYKRKSVKITTSPSKIIVDYLNKNEYA